MSQNLNTVSKACVVRILLFPNGADIQGITFFLAPRPNALPFSSVFILFAVIKCFKQCHQTAAKGLDLHKVISSSSISFFSLSQKWLQFILLDAFSGVLNATWQVTDALRGRAVLGLLSHWNEWSSEKTIKFQACTLSQKGNFQKSRLRILGASFVLSWECSLGGSRTWGQSTDFWTSGETTWEQIQLHPFLIVILRKVLKLLNGLSKEGIGIKIPSYLATQL